MGGAHCKYVELRISLALARSYAQDCRSFSLLIETGISKVRYNVAIGSKYFRPGVYTTRTVH